MNRMRKITNSTLFCSERRKLEKLALSLKQGMFRIHTHINKLEIRSTNMCIPLSLVTHLRDSRTTDAKTLRVKNSKR